MKKKVLLIAALGTALYSCQTDVEQQTKHNPAVAENIEDLQVPADFAYQTAIEAQVSINVKGLNNQPLGGKRLSFYTADPEKGGKLLSSAFTNPAGMADVLIQVPAFVDELFVRCHAAGFANSQTIAVAENMSVDFGGKPADRAFKRGKGAIASGPIPVSGNYYYMGTFSTGNNKGLPNYLEPVGDNLTQQFLDDVNASLPESEPVPTHNPHYLTTGNELDVVIAEKSDVWVTFVTEGAGYKNALGYYVFDSNNPPSSPSQIDSVFVVLPNASLDGSNGELQAGDKVKLGTFEAGKTISWVLFQDAWNGSGVNVNGQKFYSRIDFNNESDPSKKQHTVQLVDHARQLLLNGFEDQTRSVSSDNDFNDLVFYVTANPWEGVDVSDIPPVTPEEDDDEDGVSNEADDYPNDPARAVRNDYTGSVAYEDLWPSQGDYDFNDMVIDYSVGHILNGANKLVEIDADWTIKAIGASYANGFGYQFKNIGSNTINSVTGTELNEGLISTNGNGTEAGQSKATVIAFDNVFNHMRSNGGAFVNTIQGNPYVQPVTLNNFISFTSPQVQANVGLPPYNAFIFVNGERGREVHLADKAPTDKANMAMLGTSDDDSDAGSDRYYKTSNNLPWAININGGFAYPKEYEPIDDAYNYFSNWAISGGNSYENWFTDEAGNRNTAKIY